MTKDTQETNKNQLSDQDIYEIFSEALLSGSLKAGAKLGEQRLATVFEVSRERIRKILKRLGYERLVETIPNRGSYVVNPSIDNAREIYEARRIVESGIAMRIAKLMTDEQQQELRSHVAREQNAHKQGNRVDAVKLSGEFHILLAEMTGNDFVIHTMRELVARTSMLVALFERNHGSECSVEEHDNILLALESRDSYQAARAMTAHLAMIETRLQPCSVPSTKADVVPVLKKLINEYKARQTKRS